MKKIYEAQEFCLRDCNDCPDCGGGLDHCSSTHVSLESAEQAVKENYDQTAELEKRETGVEPTKVEEKENGGGLKCWRYTLPNSQWYYTIYEMVPCEWCGMFTFHGHIH